MTQDNFIHTWEALQILDITEPELMTLVSNAQLKGFDQNKQPVKHYGRYHVDQKEDERLSGAILSTLVSYFDRGDIIHYQQKNNLIPAQPPAQQTEKEAQAFIESLSMSYISDNEIRIKHNDTRAIKYEKKTLGFNKENKAKIWNEFIKVFKTKDHYFNVKTTSATSPDSARKYLEEIDKKIITFLSKQYKIQFPKKFKLYEKVKSENTGLYKFKFIISAYSNADLEDLEKLSDNDLQDRIKKLAQELKSMGTKGTEGAENRIKIIHEKFTAVAKIILERKLMDKLDIKNLLSCD